MAWFDEAILYHIYPLGLTGAPAENDYAEPQHRLNTLLPWIDHIADMGFTGLYIGPLFESVGHGYETTDYRRLDSRLGTNEDLKSFVAYCHDKGIRVILDGVFNHTGRDFFAFRDILQNRENSAFRDWYQNVCFWGNNSFNDGLSYDNWGGYDLLVKLNQQNPQVQEYICDVIRFWVETFDIDGIRLDAADVLDFGFMQALRRTAEEVKQDFWLMGEVIHGEYSRWTGETMLHSVTNYRMHKALYSGHNDHNYFEIAHTLRQLQSSDRLYNFADNHDVERIYTRLQNKAHFVPVHVLLYTLPGIPSVYYGSEFAIEGRKERGSDASLRPALRLEDFAGNPYAEVIRSLGWARRNFPALYRGDYQEKQLTTGQYAFTRNLDGQSAVITVCNCDCGAHFCFDGVADGEYTGVLTGRRVQVSGGCFEQELEGNFGELWVPAWVNIESGKTPAVEKLPKPQSKPRSVLCSTPAEAAPQNAEPAAQADFSIPPEQMEIAQLQAAILAKMAANGPVTDQMRRTVEENIWRDSLLNWVKSFR